eukprot:CAMPEP_0195511850 /NCGR_PEP_ID=MMETSP0794_2-20130614/4025_1 /TAXON_ID=515487 /ORGANISM="Stephanopyxis turris, Strain CCMP 815" /LENGTH=453 /DNA_ID=CAMNT_0040639521 /DNA_START=38 /DNA_END=1399 /DNA_ORIENTATION=-
MKIYDPKSSLVQRNIQHRSWIILCLLSACHLSYAVGLADIHSNPIASSLKGEKQQYHERSLAQVTTITFDDFEKGPGSYKTGPSDAKLIDPPGSEQHTPGGSTVISIRNRGDANEPDSKSSFYHKEDHDVSSYFDLHVQFYFLTPSDREYKRGQSFILEASSNSGVYWTELQRWTMGDDIFENDDQFCEGNAVIERSDIDFTENFRLRFRSNASNDKERLYIDDLRFYGYRQDKTSNPSLSPLPSLKPSAIPSPNPSVSEYPTRHPTRQPTRKPTRTKKPTLVTRETRKNSKPFQMKLWWKKGYRWQGNRLETEWCMQCDDKCKEGADVEIKKCNRSDSKQRWVMKDGKIMPHKKQDLCVDFRDRRHVTLKKCRNDSKTQEFDFGCNDFNTKGDRFKIHPQDDSKKCLTNPHHPRNNEQLEIYDCKKADKHDTIFWEARSKNFWKGHDISTDN